VIPSIRPPLTLELHKSPNNNINAGGKRVIKMYERECVSLAPSTASPEFEAVTSSGFLG